MHDQPEKPESIDEYIALFPPRIQVLLEQVRTIIRETAPNAQEAISYDIPTFTLRGHLVHFAAHKRHIGFYPGAAAILHFKKAIAPYKSAKGSVQFPLSKPMPEDLIRDIVRFRIAHS